MKVLPEQMVSVSEGPVITGNWHTHAPVIAGQLVTVAQVAAMVFTKLTVPVVPAVLGWPLFENDTTALLPLMMAPAAAENVF